jgi:trans-aconitate methyltransferase
LNVPSRLDELRYGGRLLALVRGEARTALLRAGLRGGLFSALETPMSAEALAEELGLAADLTAAWLRAAHAHGLVEQEDGSYRCGGFARWLVESPDGDAALALLDQMALSYAPVLARLPEIMRHGTRPSFGAPEDAARNARSARLTERRALGSLLRVPGARQARRILDVGCGEGTLLAQLLARYRDAMALGIELDPRVAAVARENLRVAQVHRRVEIREGNFLTLDVPHGSFDLAIVANNLHYFRDDERDRLFERILEWLSPGGLLAVQTPVVSDEALARASGATAVYATLDLFYRSHANLTGLPDPEALEQALRDAGFAATGSVAILPGGAIRTFWARKAADPGPDPRVGAPGQGG